MLIGVKDSQSDLEKHYKTFCGLYIFSQRREKTGTKINIFPVARTKWGDIVWVHFWGHFLIDPISPAFYSFFYTYLLALQ